MLVRQIRLFCCLSAFKIEIPTKPAAIAMIANTTNISTREKPALTVSRARPRPLTSMVGLIIFQIVLDQKLAQNVLRDLIERVEYLLSADAIPSKSLGFSKPRPEEQINRFNRGNPIFWQVAFVIKENEAQLIQARFHPLEVL